MLDELILNGTVIAHLAGRGVAAVEAHEGIGQAVIKLACDVLIINVLGHAVVDVQQGNGIAGSAHADVLGQSAVDINFAGNGDAAAYQAGVDIAGLKAELRGECRPALVSKSNVLLVALVCICPVQQGQLKLSHAGQQVGIVVAFAHLGSHVLADILDARVICMLFVGNQQVQLAVLFHFNAQLVQALDGCVAGKEVLRAGAEGDDLQITHTQQGAGDGNELDHLVSDLISSADGVFGDVALQVAHTQVVGAVQHAAVSIAAAVDHVTVAFSSCNKHAGAVEEFCDQGFRSFGAKVAQENGQSIAASLGNLGNSLFHVLLVLNSGLCLVQVQTLSLAGCHDSGAALFAQLNGEAVTADGNNAQLDFRDVGRLHKFALRLFFNFALLNIKLGSRS